MSIALRRSKKPFIDLIVARQALECQIARLAAENIEQKEIDALEETVAKMDQNRDDLDLCTAQDIKFHNTLLRASNNVVFEIMIAPVSELVKKARRITLEYRGIDIALKAPIMPCRNICPSPKKQYKISKIRRDKKTGTIGPGCKLSIYIIYTRVKHSRHSDRK